MNDWTVLIIVALLLLISLTLSWRIGIVNQRIDIVHKRISKNNKMRGLDDGWDDAPAAAAPPSLRSTPPADGNRT